MTRALRHLVSMRHPDASQPSSLTGTLVAIAGHGVLLSGAPGSGKSETALELVRRGHALVADDLVELEVGSGGVSYGQAVVGMCGYLQVRGVGVLNLRQLYGERACLERAPLLLEVRLLTAGPAQVPDNPLRGCVDTRPVNGYRLPVFELWASPGRPLATLVEAVSFRAIADRTGSDEVQRFVSAQRNLLGKVRSA